ncbi:hypothetical protein SESBI_32835 [Sesbania bispinosa]|nr:hypothetical protein SESBI_32835 [Sesbania bispinosa]
MATTPVSPPCRFFIARSLFLTTPYGGLSRSGQTQFATGSTHPSPRRYQIGFCSGPTPRRHQQLGR